MNFRRNKVLSIIVICLLWAATMLAQDIEIKNFEQLKKDQTALTSLRKDINGNACGLVRVALKEAGAEFEGNVMGDVQFTGSEYLVYLPNGTKRLGIKHPDYLPVTVVFADYGTKTVVSAKTYELKLKTNKKKVKVDKSKKGTAVFDIKPSNAMLLIDGQIADGTSGVYTLSLPYGIHYYTVKLEDFSLNNQVVMIDKNARTVNVDLTEFFAKISILCPTEGVELSINGDQKGFEKWNGMLPPGKYTINASKDGYHTQSRQIELRDNDELTVEFTNLKATTGSLQVDYEPVGSDVLLNGKKVGVTPLVLKELPVGDYQIEVSKEYYVKEFLKVRIREDQMWNETGKLILTHFGKTLFNAEFNAEDNSLDEWTRKKYIRKLADYYRFGISSNYGFYAPLIDSYETYDDTLHVPLNPVKAISLYKKIHEEYGDELGACYPSSSDDAELSFCWAKDAVEDGWLQHKKAHIHLTSWKDCLFCPCPALAWHYFYGIGCEKDVEKAKQLIRCVCSEKGEYRYPAFTELIKDMGLAEELKYKPINKDNEDENN